MAKALGVPANRVVIRVKRMGGGFGGKESRTTILSTVVAVAANKYVSSSLTGIIQLQRTLIFASKNLHISKKFSIPPPSLMCQVEEAGEVHVGP